MIIALAVFLGLVLLFVERSLRKRRVDKRGSSPARPEHVKLVEHEVTGPARRKRWVGTAPGDLGRSKRSGSIVDGVRRSYWWGLARMHNKKSSLRDLLRTTGIVVFVGPNGSGKSLMCVESVVDVMGSPWSCQDLDHRHNRDARDHARGCSTCRRESLCPRGAALLAQSDHGVRLAYSTVELLDYRTGAVHEHYRPLTALRQLPHVEHAVVVLDEVEEAAGSDASASMPGALKRWLKQLRKRDVLLRVTTPGFDSCAKQIRQVTKVVVDCRSFYDVVEDTGRAWRPRLAMVFEAYDAFEFGTFDKSSGKRLVSLAREFYWRDSHIGQDSYNSLAMVSGLTEVDDSGNCSVCNGSRTRAKCGCGDHVWDIAPDDLVVVEAKGDRGGKIRKGVHRDDVEAVQAGAVVDVDDEREHDHGPRDTTRAALAAAGHAH